VLLEGETQEQYDKILARFFDEHKPDGPTEEHLVRHLADLEWRISRIPNLEAGAIQADPKNAANAVGTFGMYSKLGQGRAGCAEGHCGPGLESDVHAT
jgi:hypothetical protein